MKEGKKKRSQAYHVASNISDSLIDYFSRIWTYLLDFLYYKQFPKSLKNNSVIYFTNIANIHKQPIIHDMLLHKQ